MNFFRELIPDTFAGKNVFIDIDGTLVPDDEDELTPREAAVLAQLVQVANVFFVSNKGLVRAPKFAQQFGGIAVTSKVRKPSPHVLDGVAVPSGPRVVVGDKFITDGLFASHINADFIKVRTLTNGHESLPVQIFYALDILVWTLIRICRAFLASTVGAYFTLARPRQWVKNLLVFTPLFFAGGITDTALFTASFFAFIAFSLAASSGYVINDLFDVESDRAHPHKSKRPIASGHVSIAGARVYAIALVSGAVGTVAAIPALAPWIALYLFMTYAYSLFLKKIPVIEMMMIALFYLVRIAAGGAVVGVAVSPWLILTTLFASLFIASGRRYSESLHAVHRSVIGKYPTEFRVGLPLIAATLTILSYALYTVLGTGHPLLIYSNIFVLFGVLWYLMVLYRGEGENPEQRLWSDPVLFLTILTWGLYFSNILYLS